MACARCERLQRQVVLLYDQLRELSAQLAPEVQRLLPDPPCPGGCGYSVRSCLCGEIQISIERPPPKDTGAWDRLLGPLVRRFLERRRGE